MSEVEIEVCPRIEIDLAVELFNLETSSFQDNQKCIRYFINCLKSYKILRKLVVREKRDFVVGTHLKPEKFSKSLEFFFNV